MFCDNMQQGQDRQQDAGRRTKTKAPTYKDFGISYNLQVVVGESLNRSIIIAICEDLILLYPSGFMDYIVYCYDLLCI